MSTARVAHDRDRRVLHGAGGGGSLQMRAEAREVVQRALAGRKELNVSTTEPPTSARSIDG